MAYDQSSNAAVYSYDAVGNLLSIGNDPSTQPSAFKLSSNTALAGSTITIYGTDFCSNPAVTFNGISATIVSASSTQIVAIVPTGATTGDLQVSCASNHSDLGNFTVGGNAPSISGFSPTYGTANYQVVISGANFQTALSQDSVSFGGVTAPIISATASSITTQVPAAAYSGPIIVQTPYGQATGAQDFVVPFQSAVVYQNGVWQLGSIGTTSIGGTGVTASTTGFSQTAVVAFYGPAGKSVSVGISGSNYGIASVQLFGPTDSLVASTQVSGSNGGIPSTVLPGAGTYLIAIESEQAASGSMTVTVTSP